MMSKRVEILTVLTALMFLAGPVSADAEPWISSVDISPDEPEVGDAVNVEATAEDDGTILNIGARIDSEDWERKTCNRMLECTRSWSFSFDSPGTYEVSVQAQDDALQYSEVETREIEVGPDVKPPELALKTPEADAKDVDLRPTFDWSASGGEGELTSHFYLKERSHEDDLPWTGDDHIIEGVQIDPSYTLSVDLDHNTEYVWGVEVRDGYGQESREHRYFTTEEEPEPEKPPVAKLSIEPSDAETGESVRFDASESYDPDGEIVEYRFDFQNDGSWDRTTTSSTVTKSFDEEFSGYAKVKVVDDNDLTDTAKADYQVKEPEVNTPPELGLLRPVDGETSGSDPLLEWDSYDPDSDQVSNTVYWKKSRYSNNPFTNYDEKVDVGSSESYQLTGLERGSRYVWGVKTSDGIDTVQESTHFYVEDKTDRPEARFSFTPAEPDVDDRVYFDGSDSDGDITQYRWKLGDGTVRYGKTIDHRYGQPGNYNVELRVTDSESRTDTFRRAVQVGEVPKTCGIDDGTVGSLELDSNTVYKGESTEASVKVENTGSDQEVEVKIYSPQKTFDITSTVLGEGESKVFSTDVSLDKDGYIQSKVTTKDSPCGFREFKDSELLKVYQKAEKGDTDLQVNVEDEKGLSIRDARVRVENSDREIKYTDRSGDASFTVSPGRYTVTASKDGYSSRSRTVNLEKGEFRRVDFSLRKSQDTRDGRGDFTAIVEDSDGERLEDIRVRVENGDVETRYTDSYGRTSFSLYPDRYDVRVSKSGYRTVHDSVRVRDGRETTEVYHMIEKDKKKGIRISDVSYPSEVCNGDTLEVDVTVENLGGYHEVVTLSGSGLGPISVDSSFSLKEDETKTRSFRFTGVEGYGNKEFKITATNRESDSVKRNVKVKDCPTDTEIIDDSQQHKASDITAELSPRETVIGKSVKVKGHVRGVRGRSTVEVDLGGEKTTVNTQPDGYYQVFVRPEEVGKQTVTVSSAGRSVSRTLNVIPTSNVEAVKAPRKVFQGETFEVCADVSSQITPKLFFIQNDRVLETRHDKGEVCFEETASEVGTHKYEVKSLTYGKQSSGYTTVEVMETRSEVRQFPEQIAAVRTGSGIVKVDLYNTHNQLKRYQARIDGIPETWVSQSDKEVILDRGESETVYFYFTPRAEGEFEPVISIESDGSTVYQEKVRMEIQGSQTARKTSIVDRIISAFRRA